MTCPACGESFSSGDASCRACGAPPAVSDLARPAAATTELSAPGEARDEPPLRRGAWIVVSDGALVPPHAVPVTAPIQVGRSADLSLPDEKLSRVHCAIYAVGRGEHAIRDLASRNGTFVNGERVSQQRLDPGDVIRVGDSLLVYGDLPAPGETAPPEPLVGVSAAMAEVGRMIRQIAATDLTVLIEGETGTGKELVARAIHRLSGRRGPFLAINAAALPASLFESEAFGHVRGAFTGAVDSARGLFFAASGGTLFLDEIGDLSLEMQAKLLRVIESKTVRPVGGAQEVPVDVRVVAATNSPLRREVESRAFRGDLHARLAEVVVSLPPLRSRREDVLALFGRFLAEFGNGGAPAADVAFLETLLAYDWPYNVRELRSLVRRLLALHGGAAAWRRHHLPADIREACPPEDPDAEPAGRPSLSSSPSEEDLRALLARHAGSVKEIARALGKDRTQIYRWLARYGLRAEQFRPR